MENERLISAPQLVIKLADIYNKSASGNGLICYDAVMATIADAPSVDAVEVVHGRWDTEKCDHVPWRIKNPEKWVIHKCSVCGYSNGRKHSNYCPNCGAKMDGGNEDG